MNWESWKPWIKLRYQPGAQEDHLGGRLHRGQLVHFLGTSVPYPVCGVFVRVKTIDDGKVYMIHPDNLIEEGKS